MGQFFAIVEKGPPPGLLALDGDEAVGWRQLTPRRDLAHLEKSKKFARFDEVEVWSLSCFHVKKERRRQGVTKALVEAAIVAARKRKAPSLEAYPLVAGETKSSSFTGYATTFEKLGFVRVSAKLWRLKL
jgi:GNAT superfamily N-acetyltransferase